ncbi:MAG TPA: tetratricopeptide repeat protein [Saprospiraceae bacterium]|nr:tetratricopeptide repeat protein [Saprospiraceae bacterium]
MRFILILIIGLMTFLACKNNTNKSTTNNEIPNNIKDLRDSLLAHPLGESFKTKAPVLVKMLDSYAKTNPKDSLAPAYLFEASQYSRNLGDLKSALNNMEKIKQDYPDFKRLADVIFYEGFMVENDMKDIHKAKEIYEDFLRRFPNHPYASNIKMNIQNLGKTPEEILKSLKNKPQ